MLNFGTLYKKRLTNIDGIDIIDLTESTLDINSQVKIDNIVVVTDEFKGKPTAISYMFYGSENYADMLFAFNGYSNMFRVNKGDILVIPDLQSMIAALFTPDDITTVDSVGSIAASNPIFVEFKKKIINRDINRLKVLSENLGIDIEKLDIRRPNVNVSDKSFTDDGNGGIILGTNVSSSNQNTPATQSTITDNSRVSARNTIISNLLNR